MVLLTNIFSSDNIKRIRKNYYRDVNSEKCDPKTTLDLHEKEIPHYIDGFFYNL